MSEAQLLLDLTEPAELFSTFEREAYAALPVNGHRENWPVRSSEFRHWLLNAYYKKYDGSPRAQARREAIDAIEARAIYGGKQIDLFTRIAAVDGDIYVDLGGPDWRCVRITNQGWGVTAEAPVRFMRPVGLKELP